METQARIHTIARILGLPEQPNPSLVWLSDAISRGLPLSSLDAVAEHVGPGMRAFPHLIVPEGTLKRRRRRKMALSAQESERLERVARAWAMAMDVYKSEDDARRFLHQPHGLLHGRKPIEVAIANDVGADAVEGILGRLKYGSAA